MIILGGLIHSQEAPGRKIYATKYYRKSSTIGTTAHAFKSPHLRNNSFQRNSSPSWGGGGEGVSGMFSNGILHTYFKMTLVSI